MNPERPRPLATEDDTSTCHCGEPSLDRYLRDRALTNHLQDYARCYVSVDAADRRVLGFYTLSAVAVERPSLPGRSRRNAPDPVPAVLLGRLAVDTSAQGVGLARFLVRDAILSTLAAADRIGARVLLVHALHDEAAQFYRRLGFRPSPTDPHHLLLLLADARRSLPGTATPPD